MLNDASINIDEEPLGHIGIDVAEDVEEEEGEDDLEEVDPAHMKMPQAKKITLQEGRQTTPRWKMKL
jgi:hypothetical protein